MIIPVKVSCLQTSVYPTGTTQDLAHNCALVLSAPSPRFTWSLCCSLSHFVKPEQILSETLLLYQILPSSHQSLKRRTRGYVNYLPQLPLNFKPHKMSRKWSGKGLILGSHMSVVPPITLLNAAMGEQRCTAHGCEDGKLAVSPGPHLVK